MVKWIIFPGVFSHLFLSQMSFFKISLFTPREYQSFGQGVKVKGREMLFFSFLFLLFTVCLAYWGSVRLKAKKIIPVCFQSSYSLTHCFFPLIPGCCFLCLIFPDLFSLKSDPYVLEVLLCKSCPYNLHIQINCPISILPFPTRLSEWRRINTGTKELRMKMSLVF
jgi:hypothetical protein